MSDYFNLTKKINLLKDAEKSAENPDIKKIWENKGDSLREKRMQWLLDKGESIRKRKGE